MEEHQRAFIRYFKRFRNINLHIGAMSQGGIKIYLNRMGCIKEIGYFTDPIKALLLLAEGCRKPIFFSNDFWTLEILSKLRDKSDRGIFIIRSGGNDIEKMPWGQNTFSYEVRKNLCINALMALNTIIVNSNFTRNRFISHGITDNKLQIYRGGVNQDECLKVRCHKEELRMHLRKKFGIAKPYIFTFASRLVAFKGIKLALQAISSSSYKGCCHLLLAGDGEQKEELSQYCKEAGLTASFLGALTNDEVLTIIGASHLFFNTSLEHVKHFQGHSYIHTETMGRSMMEAISVHTPVICTNVGGTQELFLENEDIGVIIECNKKEITNAIERAMTKEFSFKSNVDYSWNYIFKRYCELFNIDMVF